MQIRGGHIVNRAPGTPKWKRPNTRVLLYNRYETSEEEDATIRNMRGESQEEAMHKDMTAAVKAETDSTRTRRINQDHADHYQSSGTGNS